MGQRQRQWAALETARLRKQLGGECVECGSTDDLQFDHIDGSDWQANTVEWSARISRYRREIAAGLIQLLCGPCNRQKGNPRRRPTTVDDIPD